MNASSVKSVGIWIRVSTEDQVKGESPETHEARARAYAGAKGWHVAEVYRLDAISGKAVMGHAEAKRMLADIRAGAITGLVFSKLARLARNVKELLELADIFRGCGADMISLAESIDTSTPAGRLFFTMIAAVAQWEREEIVERVRASVPIRAKLGKRLGGPAPLGYAWVDNKLVVDAQEAPVRALLYELFAEHQRKKTVARILNERGYRTRNGNPFTDTAVGNLLRDPTAKGLHRANHTRRIESGKGWAKKPEDEWVWTECEAVVAPELWDRCHGILEVQAQGRKPAKKTAYLLAGYAHCECGSKMYVPHHRQKYVCQTCHTKIPVVDLDDVFRSQLAGFLFSDEELSAHNAEAAKMLREKEALIASLESELRKLTEREDALFALYHAGQVRKDDFGRHHRPISERRAQLDHELPRLQAERDVLKIGMVSREDVLGEARDLATRWNDLSFEARRQIVESITDRIIVGKEGVEILLHALPFAGSDDKRAKEPSPSHASRRGSLPLPVGRGFRATSPRAPAA